MLPTAPKCPKILQKDPICSFCKLVLEEDYKSYSSALRVLGLLNLENRRKKLTLDFAKRSLAENKLRDLFPILKKDHQMKTRNQEQI